MSRTRSRIVGHPTMAKRLEGPQGVGGPVPAPPERQKPVNPPVTVPNPLQALQDALAKGVQLITADVLGSGQVLIGVALVVGGLLLATGQAGRVARGAGRAGLFAATRGAIR